MTAILIVGDSHIAPVKRGLALLHDSARASFAFCHLGPGGDLREPCHDFDAHTGVLTTTAPRWKNRSFSHQSIAAMGSETVVFLSLALNTSRILRNVSWHTHAPAHLAHAEAPLSERVVESLIDADSCNAVSLTQDFLRIWPRVVVLEAPRFFSNASYLKEYRLDICQYVDAAYRKRVSNRLSAAGVEILPQPASTITPLGTTDLTFDNENPADNHHANAAYGKLVLEQMVRYAASERDQASDSGQT